MVRNITEELFDFVILGPIFSSKEIEVIQNMKDAKICFTNLSKIQSFGTGIIKMN